MMPPVDRSPSSEDLLKHAQSARVAGDLDRAERYLTAAAVAQPERATAYVNKLGIAMAREASTATDRTAAWLARVRTLCGADQRIMRNLCVVAAFAGFDDAATAFARRTVLAAPEEPAAWRVLAQRKSVPVKTRAIAVLTNSGDVELLRSAVYRAASINDWRAVLALFAAARGVDISIDAGLLEVQAEALLADGRLEAALGNAVMLTRGSPRVARYWLMLGMFRRKLVELDAARMDLKRAGALDPGSPDALAELGRVDLELKFGDQALLTLCRADQAAGGQRMSIRKNRAAAYVSLRRGGEAKPLLMRLLVATPEDAGVTLNFATAEGFRLDFPSSERWIRRTLCLSPDHTEGLLNGALMARYAGDYETARNRFDRVVAKHPDNPTFRYNRSGLELQDGSVSRGLAEFHFRHHLDEFSTARRLYPQPSLPQPVWDFQPAPGARLAIWGEQGVGDEVWFSQYLNEIRGLVGSVVLEVAGKLVPILQRSFPWVEVMPRWYPETDAALEAADLQLPLGHLMGLSDKVPPAPGFLSVNGELVAGFKRRYASRFGGRRTIGIAWRSVKPAATLRSFEASLERWAPIFGLPNTQIVSLQYAPTPQDFDLVHRRFGRELFQDPKVDTVDDIGALAAQMSALDAVVSVANSTVAIAHGIGKRAYVPLRCLQDDFRYPHNRDRSYWLPDVKFAWTPAPDRWEVALERLAAEILKDWDAAR